MRDARHLLSACRPATLPAAAAPVLVGAACAAGAGPLRALPLAAALVGALLIQIGTNLANDLFDARKGADGPDRLGPTRAVAAGLLSARAVAGWTVVAFALATGCGLYLALACGWPIVAIGVASIAAGVLYTGGPWPLAYLGLGDLFVLGFFGFVAVCGSAWVAAGALPPIAWAAAVPVGALATAILVVNNLRDRAGDARAGKRTLAVRFGERSAVIEYALLVGAAHVAPIVLAIGGRPWCLLALASAPVGALLVRRVAHERGRALNPLLGATARLLLLQSALLAGGLLAGARG